MGADPSPPANPPSIMLSVFLKSDSDFQEHDSAHGRHTRQLALRVIEAKGLSESDEVLAQTVALRVVQTLRMRARRGKVESVTRTKDVCIWQLPSAKSSAPL